MNIEKVNELLMNLEFINWKNGLQALIEGICQQNYFKVYSLVFSGADVNCHTNKTYATTRKLN